MRMSKFVEDIRNAVRSGSLKEPFRASDVKAACPGWAKSTYSVFLAKHRRGNPGDYTEYFVRHSRGLYILIEH